MYLENYYVCRFFHKIFSYQQSAFFYLKKTKKKHVNKHDIILFRIIVLYMLQLEKNLWKTVLKMKSHLSMTTAKKNPYYLAMLSLANELLTILYLEFTMFMIWKMKKWVMLIQCKFIYLYSRISKWLTSNFSNGLN